MNLIRKDANKNKLDIKAIEFDWIFNKDDGAQFMRTLSDTSSIELFSLKIIRYIIKFFWGHFRRAIVKYLFIPFMIYFTIFLLYITWIHKNKSQNGEKSSGSFYAADLTSTIILLMFIIYFTYYELKQMITQKILYFITFWNMVDVVSLALNFIIIILDLAGANEENIVTLSGIAVLFMWLKLFYFGRIFLSTAAMIRMILEISYDMKYFLLVLIITIAGFGNCFLIISRNYDGYEFAGNTYFTAFLYSYQAVLGAFSLTGFAQSDKSYLQFIWFLNTMVGLIIFLNLLIAIMGDTFDRVQETTEENMLKELAKLMVENEVLINRKKLFGDAKYIIIIQEEKAEESVLSWRGRLKQLKTFMDKAVKDQNKLLNSLEKKFIEEIKENAERKSKEIENSSNKYFIGMFEKWDDLDMMLRDMTHDVDIVFEAIENS